MSGAPGNLGYMGQETIAREPDRLAIVDIIGTAARRLSYGALDLRLDRVGAALQSLGLEVGDRFMLCVSNRAEFIEIVMGAMRAGIVPVPINTRLGADIVDFILQDSACVAAFVEPGSNPSAVAAVERAGIRRKIAVAASVPGWRDYEELLDTAGAFQAPGVGGDHPVMQPYTSGSTGKPKGVILTHAGQAANLAAVVRRFTKTFVPGARALTANPLYHKNAFSGVVKPMLAVGGSMVIMNQFEPRRFIENLAEFRCTYTITVPTVYALLLQHRDLIDRLKFPALTALMVGSAPCPASLLEAVKNAFGVHVWEGYGLTEGGPVVLAPHMDRPPPPYGSCGTPLDGCEVKLLDEAGREQPSLGELWVRQPGVTPGYHNLPEVNRTRLVDGWLKTGDIFYRDGDGNFFFRGRTDDMFVCGGENVYPIEVESLLLRHPAVANVCVVPVPHATKGEAPAAMVVARGPVDEETLKRFCLDNGPAFSHPRHIVFVEALPLSGAGKIDRAAVRRALLADVGK
jgi:long-chain acyl-CoA synthetase